MKKKFLLLIVFLFTVKIVHASFVSFFAPQVIIDKSFVNQYKNVNYDNYKPYPGKSIKKAEPAYVAESEIYMKSVGNDFKKSIRQYNNAAKDADTLAKEFDALTTFNMW